MSSKVLNNRLQEIIRSIDHQNVRSLGQQICTTLDLGLGLGLGLGQGLGLGLGLGLDYKMAVCQNRKTAVGQIQTAWAWA